MNDLEYVATEDLERRSNTLFKQYKIDIEKFKSFLIELNKTYKELEAIQTELQRRGIEVVDE